MGKLLLTIDGFIGPYGYSQQWLKDMLAGHENDEVHLTISSLGGQVNHALNMHDQVKEHGNVIVNFTGFVASSGTLIGMGAKTRRMSENALFLIHKVLSWIDVFGYMNDDDIESLIKKLEKEKNENAKITLVLANIYHRNTQKPLTELLALMKEDTWLNATETHEWGFVDEVYSPGDGQVNLFEDLSRVAMITSNGFPDPRTRFNQKLQIINDIVNDATAAQAAPEAGTGEDSQQLIQTMKNTETAVSNFFNRITSLLTPKSTTTMSKNFKSINQVLGVESFDFSAITEQQAEAIEQALVQGTQATADLTAAQEAQQVAETNLANEQTARTAAETDRDTAVAERDTANTELTEMVNSLNQLNPSVASATDNKAKVAAIRAILASRPAAAAIGAISNDPTSDIKNDGVDWDTLNSLPHMQEED